MPAEDWRANGQAPGDNFVRRPTQLAAPATRPCNGLRRAGRRVRSVKAPGLLPTCKRLPCPVESIWMVDCRQRVRTAITLWCCMRRCRNCVSTGSLGSLAAVQQRLGRRQIRLDHGFEGFESSTAHDGVGPG